VIRSSSAPYSVHSLNSMFEEPKSLV
jgi:hypothetical protein